MKSLLLGLMLLAGCASSNQGARAAALHDQRAAALQADGRYEAASQERLAAEKQRAEATNQAQLEAASPTLPPILR